MKKITILIPCHNEENGVGKVIDGVPVKKLKKLGYKTEIIVIDNNSTDNTAKIAKEKGARVVKEEKKGKGNAIKAGFNVISKETNFVVVIDGDNTYKSQEIPRLIEPLESNFCDVIVGSRLGGKTRKNSLKFQNRVVNWIYTFLVRQFYWVNITDVLSGYFALKKKVIDKLKPYLESKGFTIEMEMITKIAKLGFTVYSVPITYDQREGESKINAIKDGLGILYMFFKNLFWKPEKR